MTLVRSGAALGLEMGENVCIEFTLFFVQICDFSFSENLQSHNGGTFTFFRIFIFYQFLHDIYSKYTPIFHRFQHRNNPQISRQSANSKIKQTIRQLSKQKLKTNKSSTFQINKPILKETKKKQISYMPLTNIMPLWYNYPRIVDIERFLKITIHSKSKL